MRRAKCVVSLCVLAAGCAAMQSKPTKHKTHEGHPANPEATASFTPVPTVPPETPPPPQAAPLPTRAIGNAAELEQARKSGKLIGPVITHIGLARADGQISQPLSVDKNGDPTYVNYVGSGFILIIEAKAGPSGFEVGRRVKAYDPKDPLARPDLEIETNRDLGDGSVAVCDRRQPNIGGVPGINPPTFANTKKVADVMNDLACRFETFIESASSCTVNKQGDFAFVNPESTTQFCMIVARAWNFPMGDTLVSVRLRDREGNPGPVRKLTLRREERVVPTPHAQVTKTPTPSRRRP